MLFLFYCMIALVSTATLPAEKKMALQRESKREIEWDFVKTVVADYVYLNGAECHNSDHKTGGFNRAHQTSRMPFGKESQMLLCPRKIIFDKGQCLKYFIKDNQCFQESAHIESRRLTGDQVIISKNGKYKIQVAKNDAFFRKQLSITVYKNKKSQKNQEGECCCRVS